MVRASPVGANNLIAESALSGNRLQQKADLLTACNATAETLIPQFEIATDGLTRAKLREIREALWQHRHAPLDEQGSWLRQVVSGYFAYHAVPTNSPA